MNQSLIFAAVFGAALSAALMLFGESLTFADLEKKFEASSNPVRETIRLALGASVLDIKLQRLDLEIRGWHALTAAGLSGVGLAWSLRRR